MILSTITRALLLANWAAATQDIPSQSPLLEVASSSDGLVKLHKDLITHQSITWSEGDIGTWLVKYLEGQNFTVETQLVGENGERKNVFAYLGAERKTRTLITSHIDTVPPFWPYERRGDEIWGRGSVDAKGSVACQITAVEELVEAGKLEEGDLALLYVVGEEEGGDGMLAANKLGLEWETVIFGEPTELKLASGHKGVMGVEITAKGKAGHSGYPELGRNANAMLVPALAALLNVDLPWSEKYGNTTLNLGKVVGGVAANVIAEDAKANIAIRIAAGEPAAVEKILRDAIDQTGESLDIVIHGGYGPVAMDTDVDGMSHSFP